MIKEEDMTQKYKSFNPVFDSSPRKIESPFEDVAAERRKTEKSKNAEFLKRNPNRYDPKKAIEESR